MHDSITSVKPAGLNCAGRQSGDDSQMRDFNASGRSAAMAANGMVATSQPRATLAGLDVLRSGGNAMDAAIAAVAMQCVVEPESTGIGGDCFVLYSKKGAPPVAINGSGRAPAKATAEWYHERQIHDIETQTPHAVTVPGAVDAWCELNREYGSKPLAELLEPAAKAAEEGWVVNQRVAYDWQRLGWKLEDPVTASLFLKNGKPPVAGDTMRNPPLARTLRRIGKEGRGAFYEGAVAREIVARLKSLGGLHEEADFANQRSEWVEPIHAGYRGYDVYEIPPNGQGLAALVLLNILERFDLAALDPVGAERLHIQLEAARLAYAVRDTHFADPAFMRTSVPALLDKAFARGLADRIDRGKRVALPPAPSPGSHTVLVTVVDRDRTAVSLINSLFSTFGVGIATETTGIMLHNRGHGFVVDPAHPNAIGPSKRPMHTIIPALAMRDGRCDLAFGVMGGHYQAMGHAHFVANLVDYGMDVQAAIDSPRVFFLGEDTEVERGVPAATVEGLKARGHSIITRPSPLGGGQAIRIDWERGVLIGGSDHRKDGCAIGY